MKLFMNKKIINLLYKIIYWLQGHQNDYDFTMHIDSDYNGEYYVKLIDKYDIGDKIYYIPYTLREELLKIIKIIKTN